jgi:hypothetical protein
MAAAALAKISVDEEELRARLILRETWTIDLEHEAVIQKLDLYQCGLYPALEDRRPVSKSAAAIAAKHPQSAPIILGRSRSRS